MPFTPLHFGPGLAIKGLLPKHFSLSMFALCNVAMELEPLFRIWHGKAPLQGFTHTLIGALLVTTLTVWLGCFAITHTWRLFERCSADAVQPFAITRTQAWIGALLGAASHLLLEALTQVDMHPFAPFTDLNPLLMARWSVRIHFAWILSGMFGLILLVTRAAFSPKHV